MKPGKMFDLVWCDNFKIVGETKEDGSLFLHTGFIKNWCVGTYKQGLAAIDTIKDAARKKGHEYIWALIDGSSSKLLRFEYMLGFEFVEGYKNMVTGQEYILLRQGTL